MKNCRCWIINWIKVYKIDVTNEWTDSYVSVLHKIIKEIPKFNDNFRDEIEKLEQLVDKSQNINQ